VEITPGPVDDTGSTVDDRSAAASIGPWTDGGRVVDTMVVRWKHTGVVRCAVEGTSIHPQAVHRPEPAADLRRSRVVHSFHTPYYGDGN
jgi:hypothetical protein